MDASSKKKDVPSKEADSAAPRAAAAGAKKRPVRVFQVDDVSVPIFAHEHETAGGTRVFYNWTVNRSYKDSDGRVQRTPWLGQDDCGKAITAIKQAGEYIAGLTTAEEASE